MPTIKKAAKATKGASRSLELVEETIAKLRAGGDMVRGICGPAEKAAPLTPTVLAALRLPKDEPLPPSLLAWLAYDAREIDAVDEAGQLRITTLEAFVAAEIGEVSEELEGLDEDFGFDPAEAVAQILEGQPAKKPALRLPDSASQAHFLVFDGSAEPAVLGYEKEEFWKKYESFGEFVVHWFGGREPGHWSH